MAEYATKQQSKFYYVHSCGLNASVQIKIGNLEGKFPSPPSSALQADPSLQHCVAFSAESTQMKSLYVTCQVVSDGRPLGPPTSTSYKAFTSRWKFNEWLTLPV